MSRESSQALHQQQRPLSSSPPTLCMASDTSNVAVQLKASVTSFPLHLPSPP